MDDGDGRESGMEEVDEMVEIRMQQIRCNPTGVRTRGWSGDSWAERPPIT